MIHTHEVESLILSLATHGGSLAVVDNCKKDPLHSINYEEFFSISDSDKKASANCDIRIKVIIPGFHPGELGALPGYRSKIF